MKIGYKVEIETLWFCLAVLINNVLLKKTARQYCLVEFIQVLK